MDTSIYSKTVTSIFIMPLLDIDKQDLKDNNFINAYLKDENTELYRDFEGLIFVLFKPENNENFKNFLEKEYERTKSLIDDYNYDKYIVLVYVINEEYQNDINIIKNSEYSKTSKEFQNKFPEKVTIPTNKKVLPSLQRMIFNKNELLREYWEKEFKVNLEKDAEVWKAFEEEKETLNIEKIK